MQVSKRETLPLERRNIVCCMCIQGSAAVVRSYVAAATTEEERAWGLALSSGSQTLGLLITRCAYAQGRVKRLSPSIYLFVCVSSKNTAVCCLTARKSPRNSSLPLGLAIYILRKMPRKPDESSVECYGHGFLIAARPRGV